MEDANDAIGKSMIPMPVIIYGRPDSRETVMAREHLKGLDIPFVEVDVDRDEKAAKFVERVNHGDRTTPTIVFGQDELIIVDPPLHELNQALRRAGYQV